MYLVGQNGSPERRARGVERRGGRGASKGAIGPPSLWKRHRGDALDCLTLAERNALVLYASAERIDGRLVSADLKALAQALRINASNSTNRYRALAIETLIEDEIVRIRGKVERAAADRVRCRPVEPEYRPRTFVPTADERKELEMEDESRRGLSLPRTESSEESLAEAERQVRERLDEDLDDRDARKAARLEEIEAAAVGGPILERAGHYLAASMSGDSHELATIAEETLDAAIAAVGKEIERLEARRGRLMASRACLGPPSEPENGDKPTVRAPEPEPEIEPETAGEAFEDFEEGVGGETMEITAEELRSGMVTEGLGKVLDVSRETAETTVVIFAEADGPFIYENDEALTVFVPETMVDEVRGELEEEPDEPDEAERLDEKEEAGEPEPPPAEKLDEKEALGAVEVEGHTIPSAAFIRDRIVEDWAEQPEGFYMNELLVQLGLPDDSRKVKEQIRRRLKPLLDSGDLVQRGTRRFTTYTWEGDAEGGARPKPAGESEGSLRLEDVRDWIVAERKDGEPFDYSDVVSAFPGQLGEASEFLHALEERGVIENAGVSTWRYVRRAPDPAFDGAREGKERIPGRMHRQAVPGTGRKLVGSRPR